MSSLLIIVLLLLRGILLGILLLRLLMLMLMLILIHYNPHGLFSSSHNIYFGNLNKNKNYGSSDRALKSKKSTALLNQIVEPMAVEKTLDKIVKSLTSAYQLELLRRYKLENKLIYKFDHLFQKRTAMIYGYIFIYERVHVCI